MPKALMKACLIHPQKGLSFIHKKLLKENGHKTADDETDDKEKGDNNGE